MKTERARMIAGELYDPKLIPSLLRRENGLAVSAGHSIRRTQIFSLPPDRSSRNSSARGGDTGQVEAPFLVCDYGV